MHFTKDPTRFQILQVVVIIGKWPSFHSSNSTFGFVVIKADYAGQTKNDIWLNFLASQCCPLTSLYIGVAKSAATHKVIASGFLKVY